MDFPAAPELHDIRTRQNLLSRFREHFDNGYRDPELLYLGTRYAVSLGMIDEGRRFLEPLQNMFEHGERIPMGYLPVGLLTLQCLSDGQEKKAVFDKLHGLAEPIPVLKGFLDWAKDDMIDVDPASSSAEHIFSHSQKDIFDELYQQLFHAEDADFKGQNESLETRMRVPQSDQTISRIQNYSKIACQAYLDDDLGRARQALEEILLLDGDQPDVLRNLITIASELQDIGAYERYWRRYVKVLLWRVLRGDDPHSAWQDLLSFYSKVASVMDRECTKASESTVKIIKRPGFLPRWLEAHAALIWLESAAKSRRDLQIGIDIEKIGQGSLGNLAIMKHWLRVFYPEFHPYLFLGSTTPTNTPLPSIEADLHSLQFDPSRRIVLRFLEWSEFQFGIQKTTGPHHTEAVIALATFVARIPAYRYVVDKKIAKTVTDNNFNNKSIHLALRNACGTAFGLKLGEFINNDNWQGLIDFFDVPDYYKNFSSTIFLFLAFAYCRNEKAEKALDIACHSLPILTEEDLEEDSQAFNLWQQIIDASTAPAVTNEDTKEGLKLIERVKLRVDDIVVPEEIEPFKKDLLTIIESNSVFIRAKILIGKDQFAKARKIVTALPDKFPVIKNNKDGFLEQIEQAMQQQLLKKKIEKAKKYVEKGEFNAARQEIKSLPDKPEQIRELKNNFLKQIDEAEDQYVDNKLVESVIENVKEYVSKGAFAAARQEARRLPNKPQQIRELKENFLEQIDDAEGQSRVNSLLEKNMERIKKFVEEGKFDDARREIRRFPDSPKQVQELKENLLKQINEAEGNYEEQKKQTFEEIAQILKRLGDRGVAWEAVQRIAQDNDIQMDPYNIKFLMLLRAIEEQI